jgi:hypothetical protein
MLYAKICPKVRRHNARPEYVPRLEGINVKEKRIIHCKLYTVKSAQVIRFRPRIFK